MKKALPAVLANVLSIAAIFSLNSCTRDDIPSYLQPDLAVIASNFVSPVTLQESPDESGRLFVVDQIGKIWIIQDGTTLPDPFIDISNRMVPLNPDYDERGLLGLAFHPDYISNGKFYLFYTAPAPAGGPTVDAGNTGLPMTWDNKTTVSEFRVSAADANLADVNSERKLIQELHPQANHNGGTIAFGEDGYLYISIGDGGNKNDLGPGHVEDWYPFNAGGNAQEIQANLLGKILRIDVNVADPSELYRVPADNPFVDPIGRDEIWAYGFRNPYRFSFDMGGTHKMYAGDAGQKRFEEINYVIRGGNYGWNVKEGTACFNAADELAEVAECPAVDGYGNRLLDPVIQASNMENPGGGNFTTIIGGYVYRGHKLPGLFGKYIFANATTSFTAPSGEVYLSEPRGDGEGAWSYSKIPFKSFEGNIGHIIKGFGQDRQGEMYVLGSINAGPSGNTGKVFKIIRGSSN